MREEGDGLSARLEDLHKQNEQLPQCLRVIPINNTIEVIITIDVNDPSP